MYIGKNINYLRKSRLLTRDDLADRFSVKVGAIGKWERGESNPDPEKLIALSELFNVSLDDLVKVDLSARPQVPGAETKSKEGEGSPELNDIMRRLSLLEQSQDIPPDKVRQLLQIENELIRQFPEVARELGLKKS